ncbi:porin [Burkholderia thailandensis]|uniref:porin n=1 Tax=Burkholderia thailandensis TaxID=57975 RepID=UPI0003EC9F15|nr:porin [Burkholderia thailandensis]AHI81733.1 gram-negative porin family protein [Burkholderia thailandensis E444]AIT22662.1 gram-negative porin family protein [Burkholderia thailandensis E254]AVR08134.1 porin [Burkholderia thailandensis]AWY64576.1 porin [Burkholderia thailandensis]KIS54745.1 gram-negative porin family protein [Burkholderia thailandensis Phuket 4W-1]
MKIRTWIAAGVAVAAVAPARAQSSVTLYGTVDTGIIYSTNQQFTRADGSVSGAHAWQMGGGNLVPSRWGLQGVEALGGGLKAVFTLEQQFLSASGQALQGGAAFSRQAWVGLRHDAYGTLGVGRQYDSYTDTLGAYASSNSWATPYGAHFGDVDNLNAAFNFNNAIKFTSADFDGLTFGGTFSFGGQAGDFSARRGYSVAAAYNRAPISFGIGYLNLRQPLDAALGGASGYIGDFACSNAGAMYCQLQDAASMQAFGVGGSIALGDATIALAYTHTRLDDSAYFVTAAHPQRASIAFDIAELNATYAFTPMLRGGIAYIFNNAKADSRGTTRFHQFNVGANYSLSKRTALYAVAIGQIASGRGLGGDANGDPVNYAQIPVLANSHSGRQLAMMAGVKVDF